MEKIKKLQPNSNYLIITRATSKASFFENRKQLKLFENLCDTFLGGMCQIKKVLCVNKGYVMIMRTKGKSTIENAYRCQRGKSRKCKNNGGKEEIWRMISEHFRFMGCSFVKVSNSTLGSEGTKFCRNYERFTISDDEIDMLSKFMDYGKIFLDQENIAYQLGVKEKRWYEVQVKDKRRRERNVIEVGSFGYGGEDYLRI